MCPDFFYVLSPFLAEYPLKSQPGGKPKIPNKISNKVRIYTLFL